MAIYSEDHPIESLNQRGKYNEVVLESNFEKLHLRKRFIYIKEYLVALKRHGIKISESVSKLYHLDELEDETDAGDPYEDLTLSDDDPIFES